MSKKRRTFSNEFKAKVALEAIREQETIQQIAIRHQVSPVQVSQWKKQALDNLSHTFGQKAAVARSAIPCVMKGYKWAAVGSAG